MYVLATEESEGVATMTISIADDDYKFEVWSDGEIALVEFQECLSWRGQVRSIEPDEEVFKALMVSDEMTQMLDKWDVNGVRRAEPTP